MWAKGVIEKDRALPDLLECVGGFKWAPKVDWEERARAVEEVTWVDIGFNDSAGMYADGLEGYVVEKYLEPHVSAESEPSSDGE